MRDRPCIFSAGAIYLSAPLLVRVGHAQSAGGRLQEQISRRKTDNVSRHYFFSRQFTPFIFTQYSRCWRYLVTQLHRSDLRAMALREVDGDADQHHRDDDGGVHLLPDKDGNGGSDKKVKTSGLVSFEKSSRAAE